MIILKVHWLDKGVVNVLYFDSERTCVQQMKGKKYNTELIHVQQTSLVIEGETTDQTPPCLVGEV